MKITQSNHATHKFCKNILKHSKVNRLKPLTLIVVEDDDEHLSPLCCFLFPTWNRIQKFEKERRNKVQKIFILVHILREEMSFWNLKMSEKGQFLVV